MKNGLPNILREEVKENLEPFRQVAKTFPKRDYIIIIIRFNEGWIEKFVVYCHSSHFNLHRIFVMLKSTNEGNLARKKQVRVESISLPNFTRVDEKCFWSDTSMNRIKLLGTHTYHSRPSSLSWQWDFTIKICVDRSFLCRAVIMMGKFQGSFFSSLGLVRTLSKLKHS